MFFDIDKSLCETFPGLDPIKLLNYPAEDVFNLIEGLVDYNHRNISPAPEHGKTFPGTEKNKQVIRRPAGDDWF